MLRAENSNIEMKVSGKLKDIEELHQNKPVIRDNFKLSLFWALKQEVYHKQVSLWRYAGDKNKII